MRTIARLIAIGYIALLPLQAYSAVVSRVKTFTDGSILTASDLNSEFNNLVDGVNSIDNANLSPAANISPNKINASIAGSGISRDGATGVMSVGVDNATIEISGDALKLKAVPDGSISTAKIADGAITGAKINAATVDATTIQLTDKLSIKDSGVATDKIANLAVTTAKIANGAITQAKRSALNIQASGSSGLFQTTSASFVDVTNLSITITTSGRPVAIMLAPDGSANPAAIYGLGGAPSAVYQFVRGTTAIGAAVGAGSAAWAAPMQVIETPAAGTYTYKLQIKGNGSTTVVAQYLKLMAYEL